MQRRTALRAIIHAACVVALALLTRPKRALAVLEQARAPRRLAIIGGGMGGLATAWLCDSGWTVDLFEARGKLGGHCDSEIIEVQGRPLTVDLGAQFFHPDTHPIYVSLLEELGLHAALLKATASLSVVSLAEKKPLFVSTHPLAHPVRAIDFALYAQAARRFILKQRSYEITVESWLSHLNAHHDFKGEVLLPLLSAMIGTTFENTRRSSARSILQTFALSLPKNVFHDATTWNSRIGLQGNLMRIRERCENLRVHTQAQVTRLEKNGKDWFIETPRGRHGPFEAVVINAPPNVGKTLVAQLPWGADLAALLARYEFFDSRVVIHTDPVYVHDERRNWTVYNAGIEDGSCEGSVWLGGIEDKVHGQTVDVFKSWATRRKHEPRNVLLERRFRHPLITPDVIRATRELNNWQGVEGLWFAGQYTSGMDLQETALYSAMAVAESLNPDSPNLRALSKRIAAKGLGELRYGV